MQLPKYDSLYIPLLQALADGKPRTSREIAAAIAATLSISQDVIRTERLASGKLAFYDRTSWACTYLKKAGLIERVKRGVYQITSEGTAVLQNLPAVLDNQFLCRYPEFRQFFDPDESRGQDTQGEITTKSDDTPVDVIEKAFASINEKLADDLMAEIMRKDPDFFEQLVIQLLLKMGYGGSASDSGFVTQRSNDGGIDGIIREDKLGFDQIYIQAKRWAPDTTVSRPEIQKFSGALRDEGAAKGLFITTAKFSDGAKASAAKQHIVLVDGNRLTRLMIEYNIGVSPIAQYEIKTIDSDFFSEESE